MKTALITGVTGQDGSYLAEFLLEKQGYRNVIGLTRRKAQPSDRNLKRLIPHPSAILVEGNLEDGVFLSQLFSTYKIDECYNLAAQSFVAYSFKNPVGTLMANTLGTMNLLEAIRHHSPGTRYYQASTSEMYGGFQDTPMSEKHDFHPRSPYGTSKLAAYWHTVNMREAFGLFACNGILFNHESPRRGEDFVTQKIVRGAVAYKRWKEDGEKGESPVLKLGNLEAKRDWGDARDFVRGMWLALLQEEPGDYVLATGKARSVREFVEIAFRHPQIAAKIYWEGKGQDEIGRDEKGRKVLEVDPQFYRPSEVNVLLGDWTLAREKLGWSPEISFDNTVNDMVHSALDRATRESI
ncbi:MAG: GDP-mannose 4,6-dehydratase [Candidatus Omnitrophica bacterium]|nr:GDP-mannose 4,6-dehydratase [Candidatus Omnitrophota bacterium]